VIAFAHGPLEAEAHDLPKNAIEVVGHLAGEKSTILS
jgi:hypothetical protein